MGFLFIMLLTGAGMYKFIIILLLAISFNSHALRCNKKLIQEGDYVYKMLRLCGQPAAVQKDVSVLGDRVVYVYERNGRTTYITTRDNVIKEIN